MGKNPEKQATLCRNQSHGVCCHRQVPETSTVHMKSGTRSLKSRQMCKDIRASLPENPGLKYKAITMPITWVSMPEIQANEPRNQDQGVCYHKQKNKTSTVCLESGPRSLKSRLICTEITVRVPEILH